MHRSEPADRQMFFDSHVDTPSQLVRLRNLCIDNPHAHVDFPKLKRGGVDAAFFALYTPASLSPDAATRYALEMLSAVCDLAEDHPDLAALAASSSDLEKNRARGVFSIFIGMENGAPIQQSLSLLRMFHRQGVRYMTLTHNGDNALADSAAEGKTWHGLSPFGREVVAEMNRLGMMVDLSHASDETFWDVLRVSQAPVAATHSCCRAICGHRRNLTDDMLRALGVSGGYVGINFYPAFLSDDFASNPDDSALLDEAEMVESHWIADPSDPIRRERWFVMQDRLKRMPRPGVEEIADHIDHAVQLAGIDHVGLGSDYDGILVAPEGMDDISCLGNVLHALRRRGYAESDIRKIAGENLQKMLDRVQNNSK